MALYAMVRGSIVRATRLGPCGEFVPGAPAVASKSITRIGVTEVTETQTDALNLRGTNTDLLVRHAPEDVTVGYLVDIQFCGVDPALLDLVSSVAVIEDEESEPIGFRVGDHTDPLAAPGFALEVWSRISGGPCEEGDRPWGHTVFPFLRGGFIGGFSFENSAVDFTLRAAQARRNPKWGVGPYEPFPAALGYRDFWANAISTEAPPEPGPIDTN